VWVGRGGEECAGGCSSGVTPKLLTFLFPERRRTTNHTPTRIDLVRKTPNCSFPQPERFTQ
jgi:hypothetical protein